MDYIDTQFESYLQEELKIKRSLHNYHDSRIHACLYFIAPSGHSLKSLDLVTMKKLDSKVGTKYAYRSLNLFNYWIYWSIELEFKKKIMLHFHDYKPFFLNTPSLCCQNVKMLEHLGDFWQYSFFNQKSVTAYVFVSSVSFCSFVKVNVNMEV